LAGAHFHSIYGIRRTGPASSSKILGCNRLAYRPYPIFPSERFQGSDNHACCPFPKIYSAHTDPSTLEPELTDLMRETTEGRTLPNCAIYPWMAPLTL